MLEPTMPPPMMTTSAVSIYMRDQHCNRSFSARQSSCPWVAGLLNWKHAYARRLRRTHLTGASVFSAGDAGLYCTAGVCGISGAFTGAAFRGGTQPFGFSGAATFFIRGVPGISAAEFNQDVRLSSRRCAGGAGKCAVTGNCCLLHLLRSIPAHSESRACSRRSDDLGGGGGRDHERNDRTIPLSRGQRCQPAKRILA